MMLMCKNTPVYDIEKEKTLNYNLLPGLMQQKGADNHTFTKWMKYRYSSGTNTIARKLKGITFGQGARMRINRETRALSFSDCYWIKAEDDPIYFEEISPYYKPFWDGNEEFTGQAAPTLYVGGALSKEWKQDGKLYKYGDISVELQCIKLCRECGISVERADETDGGIAISNITSPKVMLEQADQSGRIDPDDFDACVEEKAKQIEQLELLDAGFQEVYDKIKADLQTNQQEYREEIAEMQEYIRRLTDKSATIQAQEARNKDLMTQKFASVRKQVKEVRKSQKVVNQYYKSMMKSGYMEPQFTDNKK